MPSRLAWGSTGWASLTDAERRVATLISQGHTIKSAASGLGISINTVGTHLRAVFTKLGVQSRVQLANYLASYVGRAPGDSMRRPTLSPCPEAEVPRAIFQRVGPTVHENRLTDQFRSVGPAGRAT